MRDNDCLIEYLPRIQNPVWMQSAAQFTHHAHLGVACEFRQERFFGQADSMFTRNGTTQPNGLIEDFLECFLHAMHLLFVALVRKEGWMQITVAHVPERADFQPISFRDGFYEPDRFVAYAVMARNAGWGKDIPEMLRNEDWNYAVFNPDTKMRPGVNQAECMACHKPLDQKSFTFSIDPLTTVAKR